MSESPLATRSVIKWACDYPHPKHFAAVNGAPREIEQSEANRAASPPREFVHNWKVVARPGPGNVGGALVTPKQKESPFLIKIDRSSPVQKALANTRCACCS
jgi:hypothetical protein